MTIHSQIELLTSQPSFVSSALPYQVTHSIAPPLSIQCLRQNTIFPPPSPESSTVTLALHPFLQVPKPLHAAVHEQASGLSSVSDRSRPVMQHVHTMKEPWLKNFSSPCKSWCFERHARRAQRITCESAVSTRLRGKQIVIRSVTV